MLYYMCSRWTSINRLNEKGRIAVLPFSLAINASPMTTPIVYHIFYKIKVAYYFL